jgi:hypothetical protein
MLVPQPFLFLCTILSILPIVRTGQNGRLLPILNNEVEINDYRKHTQPNRKSEVDPSGYCVSWGVDEYPGGDYTAQVAITMGSVVNHVQHDWALTRKRKREQWLWPVGSMVGHYYSDNELASRRPDKNGTYLAIHALRVGAEAYTPTICKNKDPYKTCLSVCTANSDEYNFDSKVVKPTHQGR